METEHSNTSREEYVNGRVLRSAYGCRNAGSNVLRLRSNAILDAIAPIRCIAVRTVQLVEHAPTDCHCRIPIDRNGY